MAAAAFSTGQRFRFPNDEKIYVFIAMEFDGGIPVIIYDCDGDEKQMRDVDLFDLIHV